MTGCNEPTNVHGSTFLREHCSGIIADEAFSLLRYLAATGRHLKFETYSDTLQWSAVHETLNCCFPVVFPGKEANRIWILPFFRQYFLNPLCEMGWQRTFELQTLRFLLEKCGRLYHDDLLEHALLFNSTNALP